MKKQVLALTIGAALISGFVMADEPTTVLEKTDAVEQTVYGQDQPGALVDRINQLDDTVYGLVKSGTLSKKVDDLYSSVEGEGQVVSLRQEIDALEWTYMNKITEGPLVSRVEHLERNVTGRVNKGALTDRVKKLEQVITGGPLSITMMPATIPQNHVFKITLDTPINTKTSQVGDKFTFTVTDDIMDGDTLVVPEGTKGSGYISSITKARSFGRNGKLDLVFETVPTIDGSSFTAVQGEEAQEKTKGELKAAGASVAGVVLLGPIGLAGGFFVHGNNIDLPKGSALYVQPQDAVTTTGLIINTPGTSGTTPSPATTSTSTADSQTNTVYVPDGTGQGATAADPVATEKVEQTKAAAKAVAKPASSTVKVADKSAASSAKNSDKEAVKAKSSDGNKSDSSVSAVAEADPAPSEAIVVIKRNK